MTRSSARLLGALLLLLGAAACDPAAPAKTRITSPGLSDGTFTPTPGGGDGGADGADGGADGTDGADGGADDGLVGRHDGHYTITLHREGGQFALGSFDVVRNALRAEAVSSTGVRFTGEGEVAPDGAVTVAVSNDGGLDVQIPDAVIRDGIVEATYTVDGDPGRLIGSKEGALLLQSPVADFDGVYDVGFIRDDEEVATAVFEVKKGVFRTQITGEDLVIYQIEGFVTSDGTIVLSEAVSSSEATVLAEASIDQDTYALTGIYRAGASVGRIVGRQGD